MVRQRNKDICVRNMNGESIYIWGERKRELNYASTNTNMKNIEISIWILIDNNNNNNNTRKINYTKEML